MCSQRKALNLVHGLPLAYLGGSGLDFGQVRLLQLQICCWSVHLEGWVSVAEPEVQAPQIFHYSSHLHKIPPSCVLSFAAVSK